MTNNTGSETKRKHLFFIDISILCICFHFNAVFHYIFSKAGRNEVNINARLLRKGRAVRVLIENNLKWSKTIRTVINSYLSESDCFTGDTSIDIHSQRRILLFCHVGFFLLI